jgi:hypothetical protein
MTFFLSYVLPQHQFAILVPDLEGQIPNLTMLMIMLSWFAHQHPPMCIEKTITPDRKFHHFFTPKCVNFAVKIRQNIREIFKNQGLTLHPEGYLTKTGQKLDKNDAHEIVSCQKNNTVGNTGLKGAFSTGLRYYWRKDVFRQSR